MTLCTKPLLTISPTSPDFPRVVELFFGHILSISQLLNRLPLPAVTSLSSHIPFSYLGTLDYNFVSTLSVAYRAHLLANIATFAVPRYPKLSSSSLEGYLRLVSSLICDIPIGSLEVENHQDGWLGTSTEIDDEDDEPRVAVVQEFGQSAPFLQLDKRTITRLKSLQTAVHLQPLLNATSRDISCRRQLCTFVLSICDLWPSKREDIWGQVAMYSSTNLVREIYRDWVRASPLGKPNSELLLTGMYS
jgi:ubiquitin-protein ligase E3 C